MADSSVSTLSSTSLPIPVDLFVTKKVPDCFTNSSGDPIHRVHRQSSKSSSVNKIVLLDAAGNPLISIFNEDKGSWQAFKGDEDGKRVLQFKVQRTVNKLTKTEYKIFLAGENSEYSTSCLKMTGWPFQRSCTIYKDNTIVAQTSLMHKLHQVFVRRGRFRLTIFPGSIDPAVIVALIVIFFDGGR